MKDGDLQESLRQLGLLSPAERLLPHPQAAPAAPPNGEPFPTQIVDSLEGFVSHILGLATPSEHEVFFRGRADVRYRLEPSLFRKNERGEFRFLQNESKMVLEALSAHPADFAGDLYTLDRLVRMQHFGLPTRLLDVTTNPLVAPYFCCSGAAFDEEGREIDGEVIVMTTRASEVRYYEPDLVSCIANLSMLDDDTKNKLDTGLALEPFNHTPECGKLLHVIGREKPYFAPRIVPSDLERIVFVRGRSTHERMASQSVAFLIFGRDSVLPETGHSSLDVKRLVVRRKAQVLDQLAKLNIRSSTIYPGLEKTIAEIAMKHEVAAR